jgi:CubicO group peptidase (beta-lactamase class C family)
MHLTEIRIGLVLLAVYLASWDTRVSAQEALPGERPLTNGRAATPPQSADNVPSGAHKPILVQAPPGNAPSGPVRRMIGPGTPPEPFPEAKAIAPPKNDKELSIAIKELATKLASAGRFSGSILLAANGKPLVNDAWGEADREHKISNTSETVYDVGSIGKLFTQIAVLQLLDGGKLALDDPFGKYLTDYPDRDIAGKVTIRQLLLHRSGLGDIFDQITPETKIGPVTELKEFLPLFKGKPLEFEPGSSQRYSNAGYIVLGMVIEAISGENYYTYVKEHVLTPAGLMHSGFFDRKNLPPFVAHSYQDGNDVTGSHAGRGSPAGGLQASAGDLLRLVQAIDAGKLISKDSVKILRALIPRPPDAPPAADETKLMAYGIEGGAPGVSGQLVIDPTGHYTRVVLCNGGPPMAMSMGAAIREWIKQIPK